MSRTRKERPYLRSKKRISAEGEKPKFRLIKVTDTGLRVATIDLVSASSLPSAIAAFLGAEGGSAQQ